MNYINYNGNPDNIRSALATGEAEHCSLIISKPTKQKNKKRKQKRKQRERERERERILKRKTEGRRRVCGKGLARMQSEQPNNQLVVQNSGSLSFSSHLSKEDEEMSRSALSTFRAKEEEIERKKMEVREKVQLQLGRVEEETKRLATIREELEALADPMRKEVALVRKKIDSVNKELKPLGHACQKKEKEYKDALEAFNDKNREKVQLITKLMELVSESERLRMKKLEELSKNIDSMQ
ncbi:hypothetical protein CR513_62968, partial [Mucuna pruriens]